MSRSSTHKFDTEADLCAAFIAWVRASAGEFSHGIKCPKWVPYAETAGWDILLVGADGTQIGVQAKLRFNLKVLDQTIPDGWDAWRGEGPDYRAVLVPEACSTADNICSALGLTLFRQISHNYWDGRIEFTPGLNMEHWNGGWHYVNPERRHPLPEFVPDVAAGASGPVQLTKWKIAALRVVARLELQGYVTRQDFREVGIDIRRWVGPGGWLLPGTVAGRFVAGPGLQFSAQHPDVYPQVLEAERGKLLRVEVAA